MPINNDQAVSGALGGAGIGLALGGPIGAGIGAIGGGLLGAFGGPDDADRQRDRLAQYEQDLRNRQIREMGPANLAGPSGYEANRASMIRYLNSIARGNGPSLATNQMREAMDRSTGAQAGLAAGAAGRGMSAGAAYRNAANNAAAIQTQGARDTANARVQEQMSALGQLQGAINTGIGQQNQMSQFNAGQQNQMQVAAMDAYLRQQGMSDAQRLAILQMYQGNIRPGIGAQLGAAGLGGFTSYAAANANPSGAGGGQ